MTRIPVKLIMLAVMIGLLGACMPPPDPGTTNDPIAEVQSPGSSKNEEDEFGEIRSRMVESHLRARAIRDETVLEAMETVPRHKFVDLVFQDQAYADHPLPIGYGQTISQPWVVAIMTEALELEKGDKVLEIGTGSGYQAAILAEMGMEVFSVEIIPELAQRSAILLDDLGYSVNTFNEDGYFGWDEFAPFDAIIVTAAPDHLPQPLIEQLAEDGRMVIPIGPPGAVQSLWLFNKVGGELEAENLGPVTFVPFTREPE